MQRVLVYVIHICIFGFADLLCQYETNIWYFGDYAGIGFGKGAPAAKLDGAIKTIEGAATISDGNGNLLFYTDGCTVYNRNHSPMKNGQNLMGHFSSTQSGIIVPKPGNNHMYYVFTVDENAGPNGFRFSVIDMRREGGNGEVTVKNHLLYHPTTEKVTSVLHANNRDYWIISHEWESANFRVYLLSSDGLSLYPVISEAGEPNSGNRKNSIGYMKASVDGSKLAVCIRDKGLVEIFDFNPNTGMVSSPRKISMAEYSQPYGLEFSPNGSLLYVSYSRPESTILQFNLRYSQDEDLTANAVEIARSDTDNLYFALQIGPDSKIYTAQYRQNYLGVIEKPDEQGIECCYNNLGVNLGYRKSTLGLPNFIQSYFFEKRVFADTIKVEVSPLSYYSPYSIGIPRISIVNVVENYKTKKIKAYYRTDTLFVKGLMPDSIVNFYAIDKSGKKLNKRELIIEEFSQKNLHPLLNYIFFEPNESYIPSRYKLLGESETAQFDYNRFHGFSTLDIYYNILNIVGFRMSRNKEATLTLTGCTAGSKEEKKNKGLSADRAKAIKDYLTNVWKIQESRIKIYARGLPEQASLPLDDPEKAQENARVEMTSNDYEIFAPLLTVDTLRETDPEIIRFYTTLDHTTGFKSTKIKIMSDTVPVGELDPINSGSEFFDWRIDKELKDSIVRFMLYVADNNGNTYHTPAKVIPVNRLTLQKKQSSSMIDVEYDNFSLILFDFARSAVNEANQKISESIKKRIKKESKIKIYGYTDKTGEDNYNRKLSLNRANQFRDALRIYDAETHGIGEDVLLYDNHLPEGRFYCRTVQIIIETPSGKN